MRGFVFLCAVAASGCLAGPRHRGAIAREAPPTWTAPARKLDRSEPPTAESIAVAPPTDAELVFDEPAAELDDAKEAPPSNVLAAPAKKKTAKSGTNKPKGKPDQIGPNAGAGPAIVYAALSPAQCLAELASRAIPHVQAGAANGVDLPIRLTGPLHGVEFHGPEPKAQRATSVWEIVDCRLALALDDLARILAVHDVIEVVHLSMYRPPPKGEKAPSRHGAALAIDLASVIRKDGSKLSVLEDWHGAIGGKTCGDGAAPNPPTKEALALRALLCEVVDARLFNVVLTPNYNKPHANHFHLEVTRGVKWFILD
jgi:hypothetical protein